MLFKLYVLLVILIPMMYWPTFIGESWLYFISGCLCVFIILYKSTISAILKIKFYSIFLLFAFFGLGEIIYFNMLRNDSFSFDESVFIFYALMFSAMGSTLNFPEQKIKILCIVYSLAVLFISFVTLVNFGGFVIQDIYAVGQKNAFGPILASVHVLYLFMFFYENKITFLKLFYIAILIISFVFLVFLRARTAMISMAFADLIVLFIFYKNKKINIFKYIFIAFFVLFVSVFFEKKTLFSNFTNTVVSSFTANKNSRDLDNMTSGRMTLIDRSLSNIEKNPCFGRVFDASQEKSPTHNYLIRVVTDYGVIASFPWIACYFLIFLMVCKGIARCRKQIKYEDAGLFLMIVPFFVSLGEPIAPFGPGTVFFFNYMMFGIYVGTICTSNVKSLKS